jgi:hypothetical protein
VTRFYADEQFPRRVVELLRGLGHDVLTVQEAERRGDSDPEVLAFAIKTRPPHQLTTARKFCWKILIANGTNRSIYLVLGFAFYFHPVIPVLG